jgi:hypothetical protein
MYREQFFLSVHIMKEEQWGKLYLIVEFIWKKHTWKKQQSLCA